MNAPLVMVSNPIQALDRYQWELVNDLVPRHDYIEIARKLDGAISGYSYPRIANYAGIRKLEKALRIDVIETLTTARHFRKHSAILSTSEKSALPLAAMFSLMGIQKPHVVIAHKLNSRSKINLFRMWALHKSFSAVVCLAKPQADFAINQLGMPAEKVHFIYDKVDHLFFRPMKNELGDYILAVGQEQRDYETLLRAARRLGKKLVVVAYSPWSNYRADVSASGDVKVLSGIPYTELRTLYANARMLVVPLFNVDYAAGANAVLESMSMGKPVIVAKTPGMQDYLREGETGLFYEPGNEKDLRQKIELLWDDQPKLEQMGRNARQMVLDHMNFDIYIDSIVRIVQNSLH